MYYIWKARNCIIHSEPYMQPSAIIIHTLSDAEPGNWNVQRNHQSIWTSPPVGRPVPIWLPPSFGWLKINFDGSVHPNTIVGLGCTIRDHDGSLIIAKGTPIRRRSVNMTEVRSALLGITLAKDFMNSTLGFILEGDSAFACATLNRILGGVHGGDVEEGLAGSLKDCPRIMITLIDRRANSAANFVANSACTSDFLWERGMPQSHALSFILSKDSVAM
ncbi:hypothetical protein KSP40_PGU005922 [Platanthera guangdongensis]|uniref:RNase H type-1 domain-containing protein n=1 Tax=Platanthera guangdongensis TaxID=2320717 RepID=A0ABR2LZU3_9ASPA